MDDDILAATAGRDGVADVDHWLAARQDFLRLEPSRDAYRAEAADLAFARTVAFLREHLKPANRTG